MAVKNDISLQTARSCFYPAESKTHCGSQHPFVAAKENGSACSDRCGSDLLRLILFFVAAKKNGSACYGRNGSDLPRPILIFVAAKKNGSACSSSTKTSKIEVEIGQVLQ